MISGSSRDNYTGYRRCRRMHAVAFLLHELPFLMSEANQVVLIVDDEAARLATGSLIRSFGRRTRLFASVAEFLQSSHVASTSDLRRDDAQHVRFEMYDCIVALGYAPPTIFITAFPSANLKATDLANGALAVLHKPVDSDAIGHWLCVAQDAP
jgi:FixJ family two-component response regulator